MIALATFDLVRRMLVGAAKPFEVKSVAPGALGNFVALSILVVLLWFFLPEKTTVRGVGREA